jgi:choline dehydrogenase-like flavoprotein
VGTAGSVLTKKLSDDNRYSVVGLHNGPNNNQESLINLSKNSIITVLNGLIGPPFFNMSETVAQPNANNRNLPWVYALPLGGGSSINAGAWCRETNQVNSEWESLNGPNWSTSAIQNTYVELEKYSGQTTNPAIRGFGGLLPVRQAVASQVAITFTNAITTALGVSSILDYNDPNTPIGSASQVQFTQMGTNGDLRASSSIIFLNNSVMNTDGSGVDGRKLQVVYNATADKVIWNGNTAVGVSYYQNGQQYNLYANKAVLVSAGIKSSTFLMRSGVGPSAVLNSLNIPVIYDNINVGKNLTDQPQVPIIFTSNPNDITFIGTDTLTTEVIAALRQIPAGNELINRIGSTVDVNNGLFTQIAWLPAPGSNPTLRALRFATSTPAPGVTVALFDLVRPLSRGSITLTSTNPFVEPSVDFGILSNSADLDLYVAGFQNYIKAIHQQLQAIDPSYGLIYPDPSLLDVSQQANLITFIKMSVASNMTFQGHCRMAPLNQGGVVDNTGHVYGVQHLIVADDSVVPVPMDGATMSTAYLVAMNIANITLSQA